MQPLHIALVLLTNLIWGGSFIASKIALDRLPPLFVTGLRFVLVALVLSFALKILWGRMRAVFAVAMTVGFLHFTFLYLGISVAGGVSAVAVTIQLITPFSLILAVFFLGEKLAALRVAGILVAFSGVVAISFDPVIADQLAGVALVAVAALAAAVGQIQMRKLRSVGVFELQAWTGVFAAPPLLALSFLTEENQWQQLMDIDLIGIGAIAFIVFATTLIAHSGWYYLLRRYPVNMLLPWGLLAPVFGVTFAVLFLGEPLSARFLMGAGLTIGGVAMTHFLGKKGQAALKS